MNIPFEAKLSIIIPTYNRAGPVCRAIDSVLRQSFTDFELIVVDDGSTDDTLFWIQNYNDPRLKIITTKNLGVSHARNTGAKAATTDWLCFLDSDDLWKRHKLSEQIKFHMAHPEILISQTEDIWLRNSVRVNKMDKHKTREGDIFKESLKLCLICASSVMIQKDLFWKAGGFDEDLKTCEDYALWLRITAQQKIGFIDKALVTKFGGHEDQLSKKFEVMDLYRIKGMQKLLATTKLNSKQKQWVEDEIQLKSEIVNRR